MKNRRLILIRRAVQASFFIFCLYSGWQFYRFYIWAIGKSSLYVPRPPAVEGFLPISALVALKRFILTGRYDTVHPAGLTIFIAALIIALMLRKGFCGWICPVGFCSNMLAVLGRRLKLTWIPPLWLDLPLITLKYLLLAFFSYLILWKMDLTAIEGFIRTPYNMVVDVKMLYFFLRPSNLTIIIIAVLIILSIFTRNVWCRYLCPYGALQGLLSLFSPTGIHRDTEACINCHKCEKFCPGAIKITTKSAIKSPECVGCLECLAVCPVPDCLSLTVVSRRRVPALTMPVLVLIIFSGLWLGALLSGNWHSKVPMKALKQYYKIGLSITHPR
ncbi:4Fe-4S binding protein [Desulfobacterota bacterium M19]